MKYLLQIFNYCFLLSCSLTLKAETLSAAIFAKANPPYTIIDGEQASGIILDIYEKLEQMTGHKFDLHIQPAARVMHEFDAGRIDVEAGVNENWRKHNKILGKYSIAYAESTEVIVFKTNRIKVNSAKDLYGKKVGIVRGYSYPNYDQAFTDNKIVKIENVSERNLLNQLLMGRLEQVFIGYRTILYYQKRFPEYRQLIIGDIVNQDQVKLRFHPSKSHLLPEINKALDKLIKTGVIDKIYQKYE